MNVQLLDRISVTEISTAQSCELKLYYRRTEPKPDKISPYLFMGSVFHEVLAFYFEELANEELHWNSVIACLHRHFNAQKANVDFGKISETECFERTKNYLSLYYTQRCPFLRPLYIEKYLQICIKSGEQSIDISGKIDLVTTAFVAIDHKTAKNGWTQAEADCELQAQFYPVLCQNNGIPVTSFEFGVVSAKNFNVYPVTFSAQKFNETVAYVFTLQRHWAEGNLLKAKNRRNCNWCEYKEKCENNICERT